MQGPTFFYRTYVRCNWVGHGLLSEREEARGSWVLVKKRWTVDIDYSTVKGCIKLS